MDTSVTILAGAIATLGEASGGVYHKPASFERLCSLADCSKTPNTGRLLSAAQGIGMLVCPEEFAAQFRSGLANVIGDFAGNGLIQGIFRLVDDWAQHTEKVNTVSTDAHAAVDAISTMSQEAEHSCEQMATQAASSVNKVCAVLGGIDSANNPHQFMKLVALGGAAIDHAITGSCGVYEQRNSGIDKVLHGHVNTLDQLHNDVATRPASVDMTMYHGAQLDSGNGAGWAPDMGQMAAESVAKLRAEVQLGLQSGLEAGIQQARQDFGELIPNDATPMRDTGVITAQPVPAIPDAPGVDMGENTDISNDEAGQEIEPHEAPASEAIPEASPEATPDSASEAVPDPISDIPGIPDISAPEVPDIPEPDPPQPQPQPQPQQPQPQVVEPVEVQQCVPTPSTPPTQEPAPAPPVGFQPHKAGAWS